MAEQQTQTARDWTGFVQRIYIDVSKEARWKRLATAGGIASWFTCVTQLMDSGLRAKPHDDFAEAGDSVHWEWSEGTSEDVKVLEVEPGNRIRCTWYGEKGWVEFRALDNEGRTFFELEERMEPGDEEFLQDVYLGCSVGWTFFLTNLKSIAEGGIDLREYKADMRGLVNA